jgi:hypothetical protein
MSNLGRQIESRLEHFRRFMTEFLPRFATRKTIQPPNLSLEAFEASPVRVDLALDRIRNLLKIFAYRQRTSEILGSPLATRLLLQTPMAHTPA